MNHKITIATHVYIYISHLNYIVIPTSGHSNDRHGLLSTCTTNLFNIMRGIVV